MRMGGFGLRSASRTAPAACWASWANALPMIQARLPAIAHCCTSILQVAPRGCVGELLETSRVLDLSGFIGRPNWVHVRAGARSPPVTVVDPGEWHADQAHLRSHSGPGSSAVMCGAPTSPEFTLQPPVFRTAVLERLRLPLDIIEASCLCGGFPRQSGSSPGGLPEVRTIAFESDCHREDSGPYLPRRGCHRPRHRDSVTSTSRFPPTTNARWRCWHQVCRSIMAPSWRWTSLSEVL